MNPTSSFRRVFFATATACASLALAALRVDAQSADTGTITGRIFNPATQEYVRNAEIAIEGTNTVTFSGDDAPNDLRLRRILCRHAEQGRDQTKEGEKRHAEKTIAVSRSTGKR